jgi:hypothetical protein
VLLIGTTLTSESSTGMASTIFVSLEMLLVILATSMRVRAYLQTRARRLAITAGAEID